MNAPRFILAAIAFAAAQVAPAQATLPPVHPVGRFLATSSEPLVFVFGIYQLRDGRVLVNDIDGRRLLLLDSMLTHPVNVIDMTGTAARNYPSRAGPLLPFRADSTLLLDEDALAFLLVDPLGAIARVVSLPTTDMTALTADLIGMDGGTGIIFRQAGPPRPPPVPASGATARSLGPPISDSAAIVRTDLVTHRTDTLAFLKLPSSYPSGTRTDSTGFLFRNWPSINPLPVADGWCVLSDGTLAVVRGQDFHIDWIAPDHSHAASAKLPHEWRRLSDSDKVVLIDSLRSYYGQPGHGYAMTQSYGDGPPHTLVGAPDLPDPAVIGDYRPAFAPSGVRADADGNVWIREPASAATAAGPIWDVVSRREGLFDRVQIPGGTSIVGFGPNVVYLSSRLGASVSLVKARIR